MIVRSRASASVTWLVVGGVTVGRLTPAMLAGPAFLAQGEEPGARVVDDRIQRSQAGGQEQKPRQRGYQYDCEYSCDLQDSHDLPAHASRKPHLHPLYFRNYEHERVVDVAQQ